MHAAIPLRFLPFFFCWLLLSAPLRADPLPAEQVPAPLQPWVGWVLDGQTERTCPYLYNAAERQCAWAGELDLQLHDNGGTFTQQWQVYADSTLRLPGGSLHWPQQVRQGDQPLTVLTEDGFPSVRLPAGRYTISGQFAWDKLPESLAVSPHSGMIKLSIKGERVAQPEFNSNGSLWLSRNQQAASEDQLDIQVFRKIQDSHPLQITTQVQLRVAGKQRQVELAPVLLDGFIPLSLNSPLPARIGQDGKLQVQLRPGEWTLQVTARAQGKQTQLHLPALSPPWAQQEIWVFAADSEVRQVQVEGVNSIDPSQTRLPEDWANLPAYIMTAGSTMALVEQHRGMAQTPAQLSLERQLWLDFDGGGYTLQDQLRGTLGQESRLEVSPEIQLGRVSLDGVAQLITRQADSPVDGVEVRQRNLNLVAESRINTRTVSLPVSGWQTELQQVNTTLYLPPGWLLFAALGTDNLPDTWLQQWNLLDLFLVLLAVVATGYLYGWGWGALAAVTLGLTWHQSGAPQYLWLNLLAVVALLRVLPAAYSDLRRLLITYKALSLLALLLIALPYSIDTVRNALYPQLGANILLTPVAATTPPEAETPESYAAAPAPAAPAADAETAHEVAGAVERMADYSKKAVSSLKPEEQGNNNLRQLDPNSMIQTGPGLPHWQGHSVNLQWSGVITADTQTELWLIPPLLHSLLQVFGVIAILLLALRFALQALQDKGWWQGLRRYLIGTGKVTSVLLLLPLLAHISQPAQAAENVIPPPEMLQSLQERLLRAPDCLPACAQIEQMDLQLQANSLQLHLRIHAAIETAVPLPGSQSTWLPQTVNVDGAPSYALRRDNEQQLWLVVTQGVHEVMLQGELPARSNLALPLPLKPHRVTWQGEGWQVSGLRDNGVPEEQLQLSRTSANTDTSAQNDVNLPPFVRIQRRIDLGLDWYVVTTVSRVSDSTAPITLSVPLLAGEQPLSEQFTLKDNAIQVNLKPQQASVEWRSRLPQTTNLTLTASANSAWVEEWLVTASPIWHVVAEGLPSNAYQESAGQSSLLWKPWAGESLNLMITRPQGTQGQTVTLLASNLTVEVGKRAREMTLRLTIDSSRGTQHLLKLPNNAELQSLTVDGVKQAIQQQQGSVVIPLLPKKQEVVLAWQENATMPSYYRFPELNMGLSSVNNEFRLSLPEDRWVLWANGPLLGPAVLFWGVLAVLLVLAMLLGRSGLTPLKTWQWFLLGIGLSQSSALLMVLIAGWLILLAWRGKQNVQNWNYNNFNLLQITLVFLTLLALITLTGAVAKGLLGLPAMQIAGNGSWAQELAWYQDRSAEILPQPSVISVPLLYYRLLMLAWALWLAVALLGWLRWGWQAFTNGGLWQHKPAATPESTVSIDVSQN